MCLIVFRWQPGSAEPLTLLSNRDEFYQRPSLNAHFWPDAPGIYAGRDQEKQGTWLGVSKQGRFSAVTNFRETGAAAPELRSRGEIVSKFLSSQVSARAYAENLQEQFEHYPGFNALCFDGEQLLYLSNRAKQAYKVLNEGIYGLSNGVINSAWPKVTRLKQAFLEELAKQEHMQASDNTDTDGRLLALLQDREIAEDHALPDTGVGLAVERMLSSIYITSPNYGTRTSTLLRLNKAGEFSVTERNHVPPQADTHALIQTTISANKA